MGGVRDQADDGVGAAFQPGDIAGRDVLVLGAVDERALRQIETGYDNEPGEIVATWLREAESTSARH